MIGFWIRSRKTLVIIFFLFFFVFFHPSLSRAETNNSCEKEKNSASKADKKNNGKQKDDDKKKDEPPEIGNYALPVSQQPGFFLSTGQNIIEKGKTQVYLFVDYFKGLRQYKVDIFPYTIIGITDNASVFIAVPYAAAYRYDDNKSSGLRDAYVQYEYAFYNKSTSTYADQATFVGNIAFPTGSVKKNPRTGLGGTAFLFGGSFSRTYVDWYFLTFEGATLTTPAEQGTKSGDQFFYQFGAGRNLYYIKSKLIVDFLVEIDGEYDRKDLFEGEKDPNTGGNTVYATPSIWISTQKLIIQFGAGYPFIQHLNGQQNKIHYLLAVNLGWTLN